MMKRKIFTYGAALVVLYAGGYGVLLWKSKDAIDNFCAGIVPGTTTPEQLQSLAKKAGVDLRGPRVYQDAPGIKYFIVSSQLTVGDYACRIEANDNRIIKKQAGSR